MDLRELIAVIATNCDGSENADQAGRPVEVRQRLLDIKVLITEFLGGDDAASTEKTVEEIPEKILGQDEQAAADAAGG